MERQGRRVWQDRTRTAFSLFCVAAATLVCTHRLASNAWLPEPGSEAALAGHDRMVRVLAASAQQVLAGDAPWIGRAPVARLEAELDALSEDAGAERARVARELAFLQLRDGDVESALESYREGAALAEGLEAAQNHYDTAVAYMVKGEVDNCTLRHNADRCLLPIRGAGVHERKEGSRRAVEHLMEVLGEPRAASLHLKARWLLNIAHMTLGQYPHRLPESLLIPEAAFESDQPFPRFHDVSAGLGLDAVTLAGGVVAEDFDGDGRLDLMVSSHHPGAQIRFYRNAGDGSFEDETSSSGLLGLTGGLNLVQADYDNDGDPDVFVLRGAWLGAEDRQPHSLIRDEGGGRFLDVTYAAGLAETFYPSQTAAWSDYDHDGDLDLYVGNESNSSLYAPSQLFRNEGDGSFTDVAAEAGVSNLRYAKGVAWGDYDDDGHPDLYVSNLGDANRLYRNQGDGTFRDVAPELGVEGPHNSFPVWFWDFDNDGVLDLYVSSYDAGLDDVARHHLGRVSLAEPPGLYRGDGKGGFEEVARRYNLARPHLPMGANFGDLDNDGFLDFYLGTGIPSYEGLVPNAMYRNRAGYGFADVTTAGGFGHLQKGHGIAFADLDEDGDQDVFAEMGGGYAGDGFANALFENPGFGHRWVKIQLEGVRSNRSAIGAKIRVVVDGPGGQKEIHRTVSNGSSFGASPLRQEIGLGKAERIAWLEIRWPASGLVQRFEGLPVDRSYRIREAEASPQQIARSPAPFRERRPDAHAHHANHAHHAEGREGGPGA